MVKYGESLEEGDSRRVEKKCGQVRCKSKYIITKLFMNLEKKRRKHQPVPSSPTSPHRGKAM